MRILIALALLTPVFAQETDTQKRVREADRKLFAVLQREMEKPEAHLHEVASRVKVLGGDPARIVEFVRKEIRYEAYPGLQRGPSGVLISGAGNSLDRAFLLAELLKAAGFDARLVRGTLPREKADDLVKQSFEARKGLPAGRFSGAISTTSPRGEVSQALCREIGVAPEELERMSKAQDELRSRLWKDGLDLAAREREFLAGQLRAARIEAPASDVREELIEAARTHAWVQWKAKDANAWSDADPLFAERPVVTAQGELDPLKEADRFVLTLALERKDGEKREIVQVLRHEVPVYQPMVEPLIFTIQPTGWGGTVTEVPTLEERVKRILGGREYVASVLEGGRTVQVMAFDYDGKVFKPTSEMLKVGQSVKKAPGLAAGAFGEKVQESKGSLASLWVDLSVTRGGKPLWSQRRGLLEPAGRESWCPILQWSLLLQTHEVTPRFLRSIAMIQRFKNDDAVKARIEWELGGRKGDATKLAQVRTVAYPTDLIEFCLARQAFVAEAMGNGVAPYFPFANLFMSGRRLRLEGGSAHVCLCYGMDLVENGALLLDPKAGGRLDTAATAALGSFDTVLEQAIVRLANGSEAVAGTVGFFERARAASKPIRLVSAGDRQALAQAGVPAGDVEWILKNTDPRCYVLAPALEAGPGGGTYAWWQIDPATGRTVGRLSGGRGGTEVPVASPQELAEYAELLGNALCFYSAVMGGDKAGEKALDCLVCSVAGGMFAAIGTQAGLAWTIFDLVRTIAGILGEQKEGGGKNE